MRKGIITMGVEVALFVIFFTVSAAGAASHQDWEKEYKKWEQKTYEAAKAEGKVTYYCSQDKELRNFLIKYFSETYPGLKLEILYGRGGQNGAKVRAEQDAGGLVCDVISTATSVLRPLASEGRGELFIPPGALEPGVGWKLDPLTDQENFPGQAFPLYVAFSPTGIIINTRLVPSDREPKSWKDLTDPWWKGKIISHNPRISGVGNKHWYYTRKIYGEPFWAKLVAQKPVFENDYHTCARAVAIGEYAVAIGMHPREMVPIASAPVKWIYVEEGAPLTVNTFLLLKGAPHPNAAKLFINSLYTREVQNAFGRTGARSPIRVGSEMMFPEDAAEGVKLLVPTMEEDLTLVKQSEQDIKKYIGN